MYKNYDVLQTFWIFGRCTITIKIMKLTVILIFLGTMFVNASTFAQRVTLYSENSSLEIALKSISRQTGYDVLYNAYMLQNAKKLNVKLTDVPLEEALKACFANQPLAYAISDKTIVVKKKPNSARRSVPSVPETAEKLQRIVTGMVSDSLGVLQGVSVLIKGDGGQGTTTDSQGKFQIEIPDNNIILLFTMMGYETQEVSVLDKTDINIRLKPTQEGLEEVVVVGYGTQNKEDVTTAISTVKGEKLADLPVTNPTQALVGQVSGVYLQQSSGAPGEAPNVRIRGSGSITSGNGPLYVIDGYPTNDASLLNAIAPQDIETMDILKDAASAAIYGSRAGNGVIIVTTKHGKSGTTRFSLDATTGLETVMKRYELMNGEEFVEMAKEGLTYQNRPIPDFLNQPERWANTDWQDVIFQTAPFNNYQLGASGGSDKVQYAISGSFIDQQGTIKNSFMKRYSLRGNVQAKLSEKLSIGLNIQPSYTERRVQQTTGGNTSTGVDGILAEALTMPPILPVWRDNGDYFVITQDPEMKTIFNDELSNPLVKLDANKDYFYTFRQTGNAYLDYTPIPGLNLNSRFNVGIVSEKEEWYVEPFLARGNGNTGNISTPNLAQIDARRNNMTNINWYWSNTATYDFNLAENHHFTALLGYDVARQNDFYVMIEPRTDRDNPVAFVNSQVKNVMGAVLTQGTSESREYVFDALFGRINYNYDSKYLFSASLRRDRSSRFGPQNRTGVFPSVSVGWNMHKESFLYDVGFISMLKVRASYGETGNDQLPGYYPWLTTMQREFYVFGHTDAQVVAYRPNGFSNRNLGWEKNRQLDAGLDVGLWGNRVNLSLDIYKRNSNIILAADLPSINGKASSVIQNIGNVQNKGAEVTINTTNLTSSFRWNTSFNISFNRNKITSLGEGQTQLANQGVVRNYVGRPMGDLYTYIVEGTFNNDADLENYPKLGSQGIGDLRYKDVSGPDGIPDGRITADDQTLVGNYQPDFIFGLGNTFAYQNFDLNILLDGSYGGEVFRSQELPLSLSRWLENGSKESLGRWRSESDPGNGRYHRAGTTNLSSNISASTRYIYDGSFLRVRNVTLGYTLPVGLLNRLNIQKFRIFATGQNLFTFTEFNGFGNPQGNGAGDNATNNGVETGTYPISRNLSLGINLIF